MLKEYYDRLRNKIAKRAARSELVRQQLIEAPEFIERVAKLESVQKQLIEAPEFIERVANLESVQKRLIESPEFIKRVANLKPTEQELIESPEFIERVAKLESVQKRLIESPEFRDKYHNINKLGYHEPKMVIENSYSQEELEIFFAHIQKTWENLGQTEPYWSVITDEQFLDKNIEETKELFYESGKGNIQQIHDSLDRNQIDYSAFKSCLEYGCGLGRVTYWLAENFEKVFGYDISQYHLEIAADYLTSKNLNNVVLNHVKQIEDIQNLPKVDLIYSVIVLQHNPPPIIDLIIREFIKSLNSGGIALFQVPTYRINYQFSIASYLNNEAANHEEMEMHVLPQQQIFEIVRTEGGKVIEIFEDTWTGLIPKGLSNTFIIQKE